MDTLTKLARSKLMGLVKSKETKLEISFRKTLWLEGIRYRKNNSKYFGKPDLLFKKCKIVIFIDSCFWHGCSKHLRLPTSNKKYWVGKISRNTKRDLEVNNYYKTKSWKIIRVWEHDLLNENYIASIIGYLKGYR